MKNATFYEKLEGNNIFENETFNLINQNINIHELASNWVSFFNCTFNCDNLNFQNIKDENLRLEFKECTFNCNMNINNCTFEHLTFENTQKIKSLNLVNSNTNYFKFSNELGKSEPELITLFSIRKTNINIFSFERIKHIEGRFLFLNNKLSETKRGVVSFQNSTITNPLFGRNSFFKDSYFKRNDFKFTETERKPSGSAYEFPGFYENTFNKVSFSESIFNGRFQIENCNFLGTTMFEECKNLNNSHLKFVGCKFDKYSQFDNSQFDKIQILHSKFLEKVSFENLETNLFVINQATFADTAYFDDLNKNNELAIQKWDRKTLRAIKRELQRGENRIDYNRFRAYELAAHYEELDWKWKSGFIDKSILFVTKISTDFGNSWRKALRFTIVSGFLIYLFLYIIENRKLSIDILNWNNCERLLSGFFRFLLVTDFYNPLETDRIYLTNPLSWLILIFGKIVIAFGVYEMIQSFRKFKA